jgi:Adenylate and Guanylate cyclase catalytic domain
LDRPESDAAIAIRLHGHKVRGPQDRQPAKHFASPWPHRIHPSKPGNRFSTSARACGHAGALDSQRIHFRIGINLGDVIVEDGDIHGDGVNVSARLEALAEPGGICVSAIVHDQVQGRLDYAFEDTGEQSLKNISRPVRVYAMSGAPGGR